MKAPKITIYTDGSWRGRLRAGGYAAFLTDEYGNYMLVGDGMMNTTISRMELSAATVGLSYCYDGCDVTIIADSMYTVNVINKWLKMWSHNEFVKQDGTDVANQDILTLLAQQISRMKRVKAIHIKAHTGYTDDQSLGNDICDYYAVKQAEDAYRSTI